MNLKQKIEEWEKIGFNETIRRKIGVLKRAIEEGKKIFIGNMAISGFNKEFLYLKCPELYHWDGDFLYEDAFSYYVCVELDNIYIIEVCRKNC